MYLDSANSPDKHLVTHPEPQINLWRPIASVAHKPRKHHHRRQLTPALSHSPPQDALKALKGLVVMSPDLEQLCTSIFNNQVPEMWAAKAYPSLKPLSSWVADLLERCAFISNWIAKGSPAVYWISGFFFPQVSGRARTPTRRWAPFRNGQSRLFGELSASQPSERKSAGSPDDCSECPNKFLQNVIMTF